MAKKNTKILDALKAMLLSSYWPPIAYAVLPLSTIVNTLRDQSVQTRKRQATLFYFCFDTLNSGYRK